MMIWEHVNGKRVFVILIVGLLTNSMIITANPTSVNEEPHYGGSLRVAYKMDPEEMNNVLSPYSSSFLPFTNIHNRLITLTPDWTFMPQLAHGWKVDDNGNC